MSRLSLNVVYTHTRFRVYTREQALMMMALSPVKKKRKLTGRLVKSPGITTAARVHWNCIFYVGREVSSIKGGAAKVDEGGREKEKSGRGSGW